MGAAASTATKVDCSKVAIRESTFATPTNKFDGAFATTDIEKGELVEKGIVRRISDNENKALDGTKCAHVLTWSNDRPNHTWAIGSGCVTFYNAATPDRANTRLTRFYDDDRYEIHATRDIKAGKELTQAYKSLEWREVFRPLHKDLCAAEPQPPP